MKPANNITNWKRLILGVRSALWIALIAIAVFSIFSENTYLLGEDLVELSETDENECDSDEEIKEIDLKDDLSQFYGKLIINAEDKNPITFSHFQKDQIAHLEIHSPPPERV